MVIVGEAECIEGTSVVAMLSCKIDNFDFVLVVVELPGVVPGLLPLRAAFSLVTKPLSWTYLDDRE